MGLLLAGLIGGLVPYVFMYFRSLQDPFISFMGPIENFDELFKYINRSYYKNNDVSVLYTWKDGAQFFLDFLKGIAFKEFFFLGFPLAGFGVWVFVQKRAFRELSAVLWMLLSTTVFLLFFLKLEFNDLNRDIYRVFWIPAFAAFGILMAKGAQEINHRKRNWGVGALALVLSGNILMNYSKNDLRSDRFAELYGRTILNHLPDTAILVASTDGDVGPVSYVRYLLGVKPNLEMYTGTGVLFKNRIHDPWLMSIDGRFRATVDFVRKHKIVYSVKTIPIFDTKKELPIWSRFDGVVYQYTDTVEPELGIKAETLELAKRALEEGVRTRQTSNWGYHRDTLSSRLCNILVLKGVEQHPAFEQIPACVQVLARHLAATGRRAQADQTFLKWLELLTYPILREKQQHVYHFMVNRLELINSLKGDSARQLQLLQEGFEISTQSLLEYPLCDSQLAPLLESIKGPVLLPSELQEALRPFSACAKKSR